MESAIRSLGRASVRRLAGETSRFGIGDDPTASMTDDNLGSGRAAAFVEFAVDRSCACLTGTARAPVAKR